MASSSKRKTTMAKLNRERSVLERRVRKQARKAERKRAAAEAANSPDVPTETVDSELSESSAHG